MELASAYPIVISDQLRECRDFYARWFGFDVVFEADWIVVREYERFTAAGLSCDLALTDEPWGQRRFGVVDPAGMWVDVVEQIEPAAGWWDPYLKS